MTDSVEPKKFGTENKALIVLLLISGGGLGFDLIVEPMVRAGFWAFRKIFKKRD